MSSYASKDWIDYLIDYQGMKEGQYYHPYICLNTNYEIDSSFYDFLDSLILKIDTNAVTNLDEKYLIDFYSGRAKVNSLDEEPYKESELAKRYSAYKDSISKLPRFYYTLYTGYFYPSGKASLLGDHGLIGLGVGGVYNKTNLDLFLDMKIGGTAQDYQTNYSDSLITANKYNGLYIGVLYGRTIFSVKRSDFIGQLGIGMERITAVTSDGENDIDPKFIHSPSLSAGMCYRNRIKYNSNFRFQLLYQYLNYSNPKGTAIYGHSFTVRFILDIFSRSNYKEKVLFE